MRKGYRDSHKLFRRGPCVRCGAPNGERHHVDRNPENNDGANVILLCRSCHRKDHVEAGDWGRGNVKPKECVVCGQIFKPERSRTRVCSKACLVQLGKRSAYIRWRDRSRARVCLHCRKTFSYKRPREKFCSQSCANSMVWKRRKESFVDASSPPSATPSFGRSPRK